MTPAARLSKHCWQHNVEVGRDQCGYLRKPILLDICLSFISGQTLAIHQQHTGKRNGVSCWDLVLSHCWQQTVFKQSDSYRSHAMLKLTHCEIKKKNLNHLVNVKFLKIQQHEYTWVKIERQLQTNYKIYIKNYFPLIFKFFFSENILNHICLTPLVIFFSSLGKNLIIVS